MKKIFLLLILISVGMSCSSDDDNTDNTEVNIRLRNVSTENFENVSVLSFSLENLDASETSEFRQFDRAYRIASVFLEINGEEFDLQIIDFVGESPLSNGDYTYEIGLNEDGDFLTFNLVEE